jgi:hypothetical protein
VGDGRKLNGVWFVFIGRAEKNQNPLPSEDLIIIENMGEKL